MLKKILIYIFLIFTASVINAQSVISEGEFLEYEVSYLGVSIANIKIYTDKSEKINNANVIKTRANIFSYDHIPLIKAKANLESFLDKAGLYSHQFVRNLSLRSKPWEYQKIEFNYRSSSLTNRKWINNKRTSNIELEFDPSYRIHDALGLFFKARMAATPGNNAKILTYLDEAPFYTTINYKTKKETIGVSAISGKVRSVYCTGNAQWQGQYGLNGGFEGWFSDDAAKVPLKGKISFIVGYITVELVKYKRNNWNPPKS